MKRKTAYISRTLVAATILFAFLLPAKAGKHFFDENFHNNNKWFFQQRDTVPKNDSLRYPLTDRRGDPYSSTSRNSFDLKDSAFIKRNIVYDPKTKQYFIEEKIGNHYFRTPATFTMQEFMDLQGKKETGIGCEHCLFLMQE